jgi:hypothetical protein
MTQMSPAGVKMPQNDTSGIFTPDPQYAYKKSRLLKFSFKALFEDFFKAASRLNTNAC